MRIRISTKGMSVFSDIDESKGRELFGSMAMLLLSQKPDLQEKESEELTLQDINLDLEEAEESVSTLMECPIVVAALEPTEIVYTSVIKGSGSKGFLYLKCNHCGQTKGMCVKEGITYYQCKYCGERTDLDNKLTPLQLDCECGKRFRYQTNMTDYAFDMTCINCESLVDMKYNQKIKQYETIT